MTAEEMEVLNKHWSAITQQATQAADKASSPYVAPEDKGIHLTIEDKQEDELQAAGWKPVALHPHSPVWITPNGEKVPGPGYAHSVMLKQKSEAE